MQAFIGYGRRADPVRSRSFIAQRRTPKLDAIVLLRAGNPNHDDTARLQDSVGGEYAHGHVVQRRRRMPWPPSICHASHLAIPFVPRTAFGRCARRYWTMKRYTRCLHSPRGWYGCALRGRGKPRGTRAGRLVACDAGQSLRDPRCLQGWCMSRRPGVCAVAWVLCDQPGAVLWWLSMRRTWAPRREASVGRPGALVGGNPRQDTDELGALIKLISAVIRTRPV